jgi:aryl-alcohol dehydrogenase-like predicted oxidoreductase
MKIRNLGALEVSELGFGCMNLATNYGPAAPIDEAIKVIREAHSNGVTFFDTAEVYGPYTSETIVGGAIEPFRHENIESTKLVLPADDLKEMNRALAGWKVHGGRMNERQMSVVEQGEKRSKKEIPGNAGLNSHPQSYRLEIPVDMPAISTALTGRKT